MTWSAIWAIWRDWALGVASAVSVALAGYWQSAPNLLRIASLALGPLLLLEALSASWMQRQARRKHPHLPTDELVLPASTEQQRDEFDAWLRQEYGVVVYAGDTWARAGLRFGMTLLLIALAAAVDTLLGTRHMTVLWVVLWGTSGHARATLRHLETVARLNHMKLPIFPDDRMERLDALTPADTPHEKPVGEE